MSQSQSSGVDAFHKLVWQICWPTIAITSLPGVIYHAKQTTHYWAARHSEKEFLFWFHLSMALILSPLFAAGVQAFIPKGPSASLFASLMAGLTYLNRSIWLAILAFFSHKELVCQRDGLHRWPSKRKQTLISGGIFMGLASATAVWQIISANLDLIITVAPFLSLVPYLMGSILALIPILRLVCTVNYVQRRLPFLPTIQLFLSTFAFVLFSSLSMICWTLTNVSPPRTRRVLIVLFFSALFVQILCIYWYAWLFRESRGGINLQDAPYAKIPD